MSVGSTLRERREALSLELPELSEYLRIKLAFLEAIENEDFKDLPGGTYATGFVKTYAKALGLDHEAVANAFRQEQADAARKAPLKVRSPLNDSRIPTAGIAVLACVLLFGGCVAWSYLSHRPARQAEIVPQLPDRLKPQTEEPQAAASDTPSSAAPSVTSLSTVPSGPEQPPAPGQASGPVAAGPVVPGPPATTAPVKPSVPASMPFATPGDNEPDEAENDTDEPAQGPNMRTAQDTGSATAGASYGAATAANQIVLHAIGDSWIQVRDGNHAIVYTGILHRGDVYRAPAGQGYTFVTGNAGGVSLNGTTPLGTGGQVMHNVPMDNQAVRRP